MTESKTAPITFSEPGTWKAEHAKWKEKMFSTPTFVFLDIDKTVLFKGQTEKEVQDTVTFLNRISRTFNLCFIPTSQKGSDYFREKPLYKEFQNLEWTVGGKTTKCRLFLGELGGNNMYLDQDTNSYVQFEPEMLKAYLEIRPHVMSIADKLFPGMFQWEDLQRVEMALQPTQEAIEKYGNHDSTRSLTPEEKRQEAKNVMRVLLEQEIHQVFSRDRRLRGKEKLIVFNTAGNDIDGDPIEFVEGKKAAVEIGINTLGSHSAFHDLSVYARPENSIIVDDSYVYAGAAAEGLLTRGGGMVPSGAADKMLTALAEYWGIRKPKDYSSWNLMKELAFELLKIRGKRWMYKKMSETLNVYKKPLFIIGDEALNIVEEAYAKSAAAQASQDQLFGWNSYRAAREVIGLIKENPEQFVRASMVVSLDEQNSPQNVADVLDEISQLMQGTKLNLRVIVVVGKHYLERLNTANKVDSVPDFIKAPFAKVYNSGVISKDSLSFVYFDENNINHREDLLDAINGLFSIN